MEPSSSQDLSLRLYADPFSTCSKKPILVIEESSREFQLNFTPISLKTKDQKRPEYVAKMPFGKVPLLESSSGLRVFESYAIARYLNETVASSKLSPETAEERAIMEQWINIGIDYFKPLQKKIQWEVLLKARYNMGERDEKVIEESREGLKSVLNIFEARLASSTWLVGEKFTLADICVIPEFDMLEKSGSADLIEERPSVQRWWNACKARESFGRMMTYGKLNMGPEEQASAAETLGLTIVPLSA